MDYAGTSETAVGRAIADWHSRQRDARPFAAPFGAMAWASKDGVVCASAVFCNYTDHNIEIHLIIKNPWLTFRMRNDVYRYVFDVLKCLRLTGTVPKSHKRVIRLLRGLGFHFEGSLPLFFGASEDDTGLIFGLYAADARKVLDAARPPDTQQPLER